MKITKIECTHIAIPKTSSNVIGGRDEYEGIPYRDEDNAEINSFVNKVPHFGNALSCIVKVHTDEGFVGIAETHANKRCEIKRISENILGSDVYDVSRIADVLMFGRGNSLRARPKNDIFPGTKEMAAIEAALWDCIAKKAGVPVYKLMGGKVREKVPITLFLGDRPINECIEDIGRAVKEGIHTIKLKTGCNDKRDVDLLREIRNEFGYDLILRIDSNAAWDVVEGIRILKRMEPYNLQYVEGMFRRCESGYSFRRLREATGIPVCICEQFAGFNDISSEEALIHTVDLIRMNACDVLSLDPTRTGGLLGFNKVCALCEGAGIQVVMHRANTSLSGALWLTCCISNYATSFAQDIVPVGQPSAPMYDSVFETLEPDNGFMKPWDSPGWGMTLNAEVLKKYERVSRTYCD
jgi:L-alanine-DL-glutamate epimerase-like enolase superfamily enzyme